MCPWLADGPFLSPTWGCICKDVAGTTPSNRDCPTPGKVLVTSALGTEGLTTRTRANQSGPECRSSETDTWNPTESFPAPVGQTNDCDPPIQSTNACHQGGYSTPCRTEFSVRGVAERMGLMSYLGFPRGIFRAGNLTLRIFLRSPNRPALRVSDPIVEQPGNAPSPTC